MIFKNLEIRLGHDFKVNPHFKDTSILARKEKVQFNTAGDGEIPPVWIF